MFFGLGVKVSPPAAVRSWMTAARRRAPSHVFVFWAQQPGAGPRVAGARPRGRGHEPRAGRRGRARLPGARGRGERLRASMSARVCDVMRRPTARARQSWPQASRVRGAGRTLHVLRSRCPGAASSNRVLVDGDGRAEAEPGHHRNTAWVSGGGGGGWSGGLWGCVVQIVRPKALGGSGLSQVRTYARWHGSEGRGHLGRVSSTSLWFGVLWPAEVLMFLLDVIVSLFRPYKWNLLFFSQAVFW